MSRPTAFVLVPGGWCGSWAYEEVVARLRREGHEAVPLTLTGLGEGAQTRRADTNLDTHIRDVAMVLERYAAAEVVLCGHSYAGMVITGAADRLSQQVRRLVYIDAYVPSDGDSCWSLTTPRFRRIFIEGAARDGFSVHPPPGSDARATPHPMASLVQRISLAGPPANSRQRDFIYLSGWKDSPFTSTYKRLHSDPTWTTHILPTGHDIMARAPAQLTEILMRET